MNTFLPKHVAKDSFHFYWPKKMNGAPNYKGKPIVEAAEKSLDTFESIKDLLSTPRHLIANPYWHLAKFCAAPVLESQIINLTNLTNVPNLKNMNKTDLSAFLVVSYLFDSNLIIDAVNKYKKDARTTKNDIKKLTQDEIKAREGYYYWATKHISTKPTLHSIMPPSGEGCKNMLTDVMHKYYPEVWNTTLCLYIHLQNNGLYKWHQYEIINNPLIECSEKQKNKLAANIDRCKYFH